MSMVTQLGYIGIGVSDPAAWDSFMTELLGLQFSGKTESGTLHYRMDVLRSRFHVHPSGEDDLIYLGWFVRNRDDLEAIEARLRDAGLDTRWGTDEDLAERGVLGLVRVSDPTGMVNEIAYGPVALYERPFVAGRPFAGGFVAGDQGLGHVVMVGSDPVGSVHFYQQLLGLKVTDVVAPDGRGGAIFLHANRRHHSLAFPRVPVPPGGKRIQHFMIQTEELDDVGRGQDIAEDRGQLLVRLGRHSNDLMISCYLQTPSGWGVEYGWGAREIDGDWTVVQHADGDVWGHRLVRDTAGFGEVFDK